MTMDPDYPNRMAQTAKRGPGRPTNAEIAARKEMPADVLPVVQYSVRCPCCGIYVFPQARGTAARRLANCPRCSGGMVIKYDATGKPDTVSRT